MTSRLLQPGSVYARTREPNVRTVEAPAAILRYNLIPRHDCVSTGSVLAHKRLVSGCRQGAPPISIRALSLHSSPFSLVLGVEWHSDWLSANRFALLDMAHRYHRGIGPDKHGTVLLRQPLSALESLSPSMLNYSLLRHPYYVGDAPARKQAGYGVVSGRLAWLNSSGLLR